MWSRPLALALLLLPTPALADVKEKVAALAPSGMVLVVDLEGNELVAQNADEPFVPASVTKIVTAWLALEVLGGDSQPIWSQWSARSRSTASCSTRATTLQISVSRGSRIPTMLTMR